MPHTTIRSLLLAGLLVPACGLPSGQGSTGVPSNCQAMASDDSYLMCAGAFIAGDAAKLCPDGYVLPMQPMPSNLSAVCDLSPNTPFFAVNFGSWTNPNAATENSCAPKDGWIPSLRGCGSENGATEYAAQDCAGWPHGLICGKSASWKCPDGNLSTASNTSPSEGVVCQKLAR